VSAELVWSVTLTLRKPVGGQLGMPDPLIRLGSHQYYRAVKRLATGMVFAFAVTACVGEVGPIATTTSAQLPTTISPATSTTIVVTTTTSQPVVQLPVDAICAMDGVPDTGEATVVVEGRLYGLGADGMSPRCLAAGVSSMDVDWGPLGDRVRVGEEIITASARFALGGASSLQWTRPTGSRIVAITPERLWKVAVEDLDETDITFLEDNFEVAYHPAGEHLLAIGTDFEGQYGLWLATNQGTDPLLLAFDEGATMADPAWTGLGEPLFVAAHFVESEEPIDSLTPSMYDPIMLAYRIGGEAGVGCVEGGHVALNGIDVPEPLSSWTSTPVGWLSAERLLVLAYPDGCGTPGDLWSFSTGFCPGSVYGASLLISGVDGAAAREIAPQAPPPPDFTGVIDPAPA
jgi:hypothetical protein